MNLKKNKTDATLTFLTRGKGGKGKVLLAQKVRKLIVGCYNGFGGSQNKGETLRECATRELKRESGLIAMKRDLEFVGVVTFHNQRKDKSRFSIRVFIFLLTKWRGRLRVKEDEMKNPRWFKTYRLPLKRMAPGDRNFVPQLLDESHAGKIVRGEIWYSKDQKRVLRSEIKWTGKTGDVD